MKATAIAHANIAFTKFWGKAVPELNIPFNNSISMNLSNAITTTTVEFSDKYDQDIVDIVGTELKENEKQRIIKHLDKIRKLAGIETKARIVSKNSFPKSAGIASSASGHAALALAASAAAGLRLNEKELSCLARLGSGSACRSIPAGFAEWHKGNSHDTSYATQICKPEDFDILDIVAITSGEEKKVSTTEGHELVHTSPLFPSRIKSVEEFNEEIKKAILNNDFKTFGGYTEKDALSLHAIMITSSPSIRYWNQGSLKVMDMVEGLRKNDIDAYFTIDAGPNIHIITLPEFPY